MKRVVAGLLALLASAAPSAAEPAPCEILAAAIHADFEADADLDRVYARLATGPAWSATGVVLSPRARGAPRPVAVAGRRYLADFAAPDIADGFPPGSTRTITLRPAAAPGRVECRLRLVGESMGRFDELRPADAAAESARRAPMAILDPALPKLARALGAAPSVDAAALLGTGAETVAAGTFAFMAGGARFQLSLVPVPDTDGEFMGMLARLVPELGNRERPLGMFRYIAATRLGEIRVE